MVVLASSHAIRRRVIATRRRAFTLVELLVVIAIIGLLSTVAIVAMGNARIKARDMRRIADLKQIQTALALYYEDNGFYPPSGCGYDCNGWSVSYHETWTALGVALAPYLAKLPVDPIGSSCPPWDSCYSYAYGDVGRDAFPAGYDLVALLEDTSNNMRCGVQQYKFHIPWGTPWCGAYPSQLYVVKP
jgi:prepilin-type N-terminal cleavage/methylation domain-containing protein